jgi:hypothetical protein
MIHNRIRSNFRLFLGCVVNGALPGKPAVIVIETTSAVISIAYWLK